MFTKPYLTGFVVIGEVSVVYCHGVAGGYFAGRSLKVAGSDAFVWLVVDGEKEEVGVAEGVMLPTVALDVFVIDPTVGAGGEAKDVVVVVEETVTVGIVDLDGQFLKVVDAGDTVGFVKHAAGLAVESQLADGSAG